MTKYDFSIAGRWRNRETVKEVLDIVRSNGFSAYSFIENLYKGEKVEFSFVGDIEAIMQKLESLPQDDPFVRKVFDTDITAERNSDNFLLVLPAGISGHVEAGAAYGMGKKCYAVGKLEKTETLYNIFEEIFPDTNALKKWLNSSK
ncbi:MAG TPA: hypothetical protein VMR18_01255 [Candidatus Saccharimonadales bacterium]|nr:hypothetical protein [Candidatus Saccharimonadales bacterium]